MTGQADAPRATALHESNDLKPFTSSNLIGLRPQGGEGGQRAGVQPGAAFRWRVTAFEPGLAGLWLERILPHLPETLTIGGVGPVAGCFRVSGGRAPGAGNNQNTNNASAGAKLKGSEGVCQ